MINHPKVCILTGFGINSDAEIMHAFNLGGGDSQIVHLNDLVDNRKNLNDYHILAIPGGFSFGDDISAGKIFAVKLRNYLYEELKKFVDDGKLVIGIGNGFQILVKMGFLPDSELGQIVTLSSNNSGKFENRLIYLSANNKSPCIFTKGIDKIQLPVMHNEGKFIIKDANVLKNLEKNNLIVLKYCDDKGKPANKYPDNPDGSANNIAGICDKTGRVFGMMARAEMFITKTDYSSVNSKKNHIDNDALKIFKNAVNYVNSKILRK